VVSARRDQAENGDWLAASCVDKGWRAEKTRIDTYRISLVSLFWTMRQPVSLGFARLYAKSESCEGYFLPDFFAAQ
jgi:hypothetical protein